MPSLREMIPMIAMKPRLFLLLAAPVAALLTLSGCQSTGGGDAGGDPLAMDYPFDEQGNYIESAARGGGGGSTTPVASYNPPPPSNYEPITSDPPTASPPVSSPPPPSRPKPQTVSYTVRKGDTLSGIAKRHGTSVSAIRSANGLSGDLIRIGQSLRVPKGARSVASSGGSRSSGGSYTVQRGDTLWGIARRNGTSVSRLKSVNGLSSDVLQPGQTLKLP